MPYLNSLCLLVLLSLLFACGNEPSAERQDYLDQEWVFALDNPEGSPFLMNPLSVGDVASFRGDTVILNNHFTGLENKLQLIIDPTELDSNKRAITVERVGRDLNLTLYLHDSLITSAILSFAHSKVQRGIDRIQTATQHQYSGTEGGRADLLGQSRCVCSGEEVT